ncbi:DHA2 family efflux MFS transporter permease subunit [Herbiconiux sp. CPCC 205763]|uniref:DHA2 family efflux MFS transporter permease subunit n=1 Tax=Herbiconiux aconitum TaxID=2970913 RepID=A0ABT2GVZ9_9MICO|nr:DHA2 family efflux MFS transporter permease subunit [Herbiconiux aconitum]MCS5720333.1 DHA2 family efflux MFS transporter permease subunit [Herbiconiux aconitum]
MSSIRRKYAVLAICCSSLFLVSLDGTIVNVALPSIARELNSTVSTLQWTVDAYLLVLAALLLLSGSLADRFGRKRVFAVGLTIFTTGSLLCSLAPTDTWLIVFRMFQAVGGSAMTPVALAIVTNIFVLPRERARAIGIWAAVSGVGIAAGPLIGGVLIDSVGWRSIFWINVPTGAAAIVLTLLVIRESRASHPRALDPIGQLLVVVFLISLIFAIIEAPRFAVLSPWIIGGGLVAAVSFTALLRYESRHPEPLVPLSLFTQRSFAGAFVIAILGFLAFNGLLFVNTLYLQSVRDLSASLAGVLTLPLAAATVIAAPLSGRLLSAVGARRPFLIAGACMASASLILIAVTPTEPVLWLTLPYAIFGVGYGMLNAPVNDTAVSELPDDQAGVAASLISTSKQVGSALGVAITGTIIAASPGDSMVAAFDARAWIVWVIIAACGLGIVIVARSWPSRRSPARSSRPARG